MRTCQSCYRQVEDPAHLICPDCGTTLPKPDQMSSEDESDCLFAEINSLRQENKALKQGSALAEIAYESKDSEVAMLEDRITELVNENAELEAKVEAYKQAIERGKGNDCPPDGDAISTCPIDTDKDCTACWAEYLLRQI